MRYGDILKKLRNEKGLSQKELTDRLQINRSTYARYETSSTQPDFDTLKKIADYYEVTTDYLLGHSNNPKSTYNDEIEAIRNDASLSVMFDNWKGMSEEERERALEFVNFLIHEREKDK